MTFIITVREVLVGNGDILSDLFVGETLNRFE
jgi:hypothetical protein